MQTSTTDLAVLSLEELRRFDTRETTSGGQLRFCCPLPACGSKLINRQHQSLTANPTTGAFYCQRCKGKGVLREFWTERPDQPAPRFDKRQAAQDNLRRAFALPAAKEEPRPIDPEQVEKVSRLLTGCVAIEGTPGAAYLESRGISVEVADASGVLYHPNFRPGRAAVVFCLRDPEGAVVALQGRLLTGDQNKQSNGPIGQGIFATAGTWEASCLTICEAPIDALSLAVMGIPALALCGTAQRPAFRRRFAWKDIALAFDADQEGDRAAAAWADALTIGTTCKRWRPEGAKDWNEVLQGILNLPPFPFEQSGPVVLPVKKQSAAVLAGPLRYGKDGGEWVGPDLQTLPIGFCVSCQSIDAPLLVEGEQSRCTCCAEADERQAGQPIECELYCEPGQTLLLHSVRFDPGGMRVCLSCAKRLRARLAQRQIGTPEAKEATA